MAERLVVVHPDAATLTQAAAARLLTRLLDLQSVQDRIHLVLTGGTIGIDMLAAVRDNPVRDAVDWSLVHVWWGDERFVPEGDADRNERQAREALLDVLSDAHGGPLPEVNIHAMPAAAAGVTPDDGAGAYAHVLAEHADEPAASGSSLVRVPAFDVLLLGMGPDAHVASLFPGHPALGAGGATTGVEDSPKPPPQRISLTFDAIHAAREVWIVAAGEGKADAVARALGGAPVEEAPAGGAVGRERTLWLVDAAAASQVTTQPPPPVE